MKVVEAERTNLRRLGWVMAMVVATVLICELAPAVKNDQPGVRAELPYHVGPLWAFPQAISQAELTILPSDTTFARKAYGLAGSDPSERISCTIVLSGSVPRGLHRPERCLPGQGYIIDHSKYVNVPLNSGHSLEANALSLEHPYRLADGRSITVKSYLLYWYTAQNVATPYRLERIFVTSWDLLVHRLNHRWAYVYVMTNITEGLRPNGRTPPQTMELLKSFIRDSVPYYMKSEMTEDTASVTSDSILSAGD